MTLQELTEKVKFLLDNKLDTLVLVIPRKTNPRGEHIRFKGLGKGKIYNVKDAPNGGVDIVAAFSAEYIAKNLRKEGFAL